MPISPSLAERMLFLLNQGPGPMLDFLGAQAFRAVSVAVKLGVFEALSGGALAAGQVARRIEGSESGTALLIDALVALGYLKRKGGRYANTRMTAKWLLRGSRTSLAAGIPFFESMVFERWSRLDESIRLGQPAMPGSAWLEQWLEQGPDRWRIYQDGMIAIARMAAGEIVAKVPLPRGARRLLDIGGGHGLYSIAFCRRHPELSCTVFDLPQALEVARETIAFEHMGARVGVQAGDFCVNELGGGYDVALLFNIVHAFLPEQNAGLLQKAARALNPGGLIVINDQIAQGVRGATAKAVVSLQALNYLNDLGGRTYGADEIHGWLAKAGFGRPRRIRLRRTPGFALILSRRNG